MGFSKAQIKYYLTNFRTRKSYLLFQIFQLILAFFIIIIALTSPIHFRQPLVLYLQFFLLALMSFDLLIVRWISEEQLWKSKMNKLDLAVLVIFVGTFVFLCLTQKQIQNKEHDESSERQILLEIDDVLVIGVVMCRYAFQIYRIIMNILNTRKNMLIQRKIKQIDLNTTPKSAVYDNNEFIQDQILREKITRINSERERMEEKIQE